MHSYKNGGLIDKYQIQKKDGSGLSGSAHYFVLRIDADPHARVALAAYAESVRTDNGQLSHDLREWLDDTEVAFTQNMVTG